MADDNKKVSDIIPKNEEWYTLDLDRNSDDSDDKDKMVHDIASSADDPTSLDGSSMYEGTVVDSDDDNDSTDSREPGDAGHGGIDDGTR